jgi:tripartite-type tricarboxylate transporter receptor subunit TctC
MNWRAWVAAAAAAVALCAAWPAAAQTFPARSITLVVPYPPGGGVDSMARVAADKLAAALGQPVVVENRGGAGGNIGTRFVAKSKPDGYTLLLGHTGSISINPSLYANAGYDPRKDFAPVGLMASMPVALLAHPSFSAKTVTDVIAYAKANPGKLNVGTSSIGTGGYMSAELFKATTGIDVAIVPYKGTAPLMNDLIGGHVPVAFGVLPPALGNLQAGTLRAIAMLSRTRFSLLPDVPTAEESGLPGFEAVLHYGVLAPAGTPKPIVDKINSWFSEIVRTEETKKFLALSGADPMIRTPEEAEAMFQKAIPEWAEYVRIAKIPQT